MGALRVFMADVNVTNSVKIWEVIGKQSISGIDWKQGIFIFHFYSFWIHFVDLIFNFKNFKALFLLTILWMIIQL